MKSMTEPFKATVRLLDGRLNSSDGLIFFDSILYHAWFTKNAPHVLRGESNDWYPNYFGLPLRQLDGGRYASSCGFYKQYDTSVEYWAKRPDFLGAQTGSYFDNGKAAKVNTSSGAERAYRTPNIVRLVGDIEFYGYGTISKIIDLLKLIPSLGKKPAMGWGAIESFSVEPWPEDWSSWSEKYGLMRPMPVEEYDGQDKNRYRIGMCGIRPPYWKPINQVMCYVPEVVESHRR